MRTPKTLIRLLAGITSLGLVGITGTQLIGPMLERSETETLTYPAGSERIELANGIGSVRVRAAAAGEDPHLEVRRTWGLTAPETGIQQEGSTARLTGTCDTGFTVLGDVCRTEWVLVVPAETDLYFRVADNAAELPHLRDAVLQPIPSIWGHRAGNPSINPADATFLRDTVRAFLATAEAGAP